MRATSQLPHPALRPYVERYLSVDAMFPSRTEQRVSPCRGPVLVVLLEGVQQAGVLGDSLERMPPVYIIGHLDRAAVNVLVGPLRCFMVQFSATGAYRLLGISARELTNRSVELGAVAGREFVAWAERLAELPNPAARAAATDALLRDRLSAHAASSRSSRELQTATAACALIEQARGRIKVEFLARQLQLTPRTLLRRFHEAVGIPVRTSARIVRFLAARAHLDRHPTVSWGDVAGRFGYSDQSHLIRDFQRYCGEAPSVFRSRQHEARLITVIGRESAHAIE